MELAGRIHHPPLHPSIFPVPMGCLGVSHSVLLQGYVKAAVKWKSWDIASKGLEIIFELCPVVLAPSFPILKGLGLFLQDSGDLWGSCETFMHRVM